MSEEGEIKVEETNENISEEKIKEDENEKPFQEKDEKIMTSNNQSKFDHQEYGQYANVSLQMEDEEQTGIKLRIVGTDFRGSTFTKYTVYIIKGQDKNGQINICRRFNEFYEMRVAMVKRWPGCFIPSIPSKNFVKKNEKDMVQKRERYLNDFVIKMTKLPHLYLSEEFQTFLRSSQPDVSKLYESWPTPSNESIINKYRDCFNKLEGKQINQATNEIISQFYASVKKNQMLLQKYRGFAKELALARDKYNACFPRLASLVIPAYEKTCMAEYVDFNEQHLVYLNSSQAKLSEHARMTDDLCMKNPYWLLYDLIKNQQRDGRAFIEALSSQETLQGKRNEIDAKMKNNEKILMEAAQGKKKSFSEQQKYKLQSELEEFKKEKDTILMLCDIISALTVYIEIQNYKNSKIKFYHNTLRKLGGFEINNAQISAEIWSGAKQSAKKISGQCNAKY